MDRVLATEGWPTEELRQQAKEFLASWPADFDEVEVGPFDSPDVGPGIATLVKRRNPWNQHTNVIQAICRSHVLAVLTDLPDIARRWAHQCAESFQQAEDKTRVELLVDAKYHDTPGRSAFTRDELVDTALMASRVLARTQ